MPLGGIRVIQNGARFFKKTCPPTERSTVKKCSLLATFLETTGLLLLGPHPPTSVMYTNTFLSVLLAVHSKTKVLGPSGGKAV